jgi:hypothetical protein
MPLSGLGEGYLVARVVARLPVAAGRSSFLLHVPGYVLHPWLELPAFVAQPPPDRHGAVVIPSHLARGVQVILEASRPDESEYTIHDLSLIAITVFGKRPVVAEEDDAKFSGLRIIEPIVDAPERAPSRTPFRRSAPGSSHRQASRTLQCSSRAPPVPGRCPRCVSAYATCR